MTQRQSNCIHAAAEGIRLAREMLDGPGGQAAMLRAMRDDMPWKENDTAMGVARAAYLACVYLAWVEAGKPDFDA